MRLHPNAKLTPWARHRLAQRVREQGWPLARAAREAGVSRPTAYKWLNRFDSEGQVGLQDRFSRPHRIPKRTPLKAIRRMERLRRRRKTRVGDRAGDRDPGIDGLAASQAAGPGPDLAAWRRSSIRRSATSMPLLEICSTSMPSASRGSRGRTRDSRRSQSQEAREWAGRWRSSASMTIRAWPTPRCCPPRTQSTPWRSFVERCAGSGDSGSAASACSRTTPSAMRRPRPSARYARKKASCRASPVPTRPRPTARRSASSRRSSDAGPIANRSGPPRSGPPRFPVWLKHYNHHRPHRSLGKKTAHGKTQDRPANNVLSRLLKNSSSKGTFEGSPKGEM